MFVLSLDLGTVTDRYSIKTKYCDINNFFIKQDEPFEFQYGVMYQFVDHSIEAIERSKRRLLNRTR